MWTTTLVGSTSIPPNILMWNDVVHDLKSKIGMVWLALCTSE